MTENDRQHGRRAVDAAGELAIESAQTWLRALSWGAHAVWKAGNRLTAVSDTEAALDLVHDASSAVRRTAREFLGISDLEERIPTGTRAGGGPTHEHGRATAASERELRARGAELLRESAEVSVEERAHPAHAWILEQLAPDEARILRLLKVKGPQPAVDVCSANLIGAASEIIAPNLTLLGPDAGCRDEERVPTYLNNLERLGLIQFLDSPLEDLAPYQVLEAQPMVLGTIRNTRRAKARHRSLHLTPFGVEFCDLCVPLDTRPIEHAPGTEAQSDGI